MAGPTLTQVRQLAATEMGTFETGTATSGSTAVGTLICATSPFKSTRGQNTLYKDGWIARPAAVNATDKSRIVKSYDASTGTFTPDADYAVAAYAGGQGEAFEIHNIVEPMTKLLAYLNDALREMLVPVEFSFVPSSNTALRHSLATAAPWLTDPGRILAVNTLPTSAVRDNYELFAGGGIRVDAYADAETVYLRGGYSTSDTVYIRALKPAYYECYTSLGVRQDGLIAESDTVSARVTREWAAWGAIYYTWKRNGAVLAANDRIKVSEREAFLNWRDNDPGYAGREPQTAKRVQQWGPRR